MKRIKWELEEAVALFDLYFKNGQSLSIPNEQLLKLSELLHRRAQKIGLETDDKFRNISGLNMQLGCIHFVVTDGIGGLSSASKLFYETYELFLQNPTKFQNILDDFYKKYDK